MGRRTTCWSFLIVAFAAVVVGCGGSVSAVARHGILFTYEAPSIITWHGGGDVYAWVPGSSPLRVVRTASPAVGPEWSPEGTQIAWGMEPPSICRSEAGECGKFGCEDQVYVSRGGGQPQRVTPDYIDSGGNHGCSTAPISWSPDGTQLVFLRISNIDPQSLAIVSLKTGAVQPLHVGGVAYAPVVWGKQGIAYIDTATNQIRVVAPSSGGLRFAISLDHSDPGGDFALAWSSHGELATIEGKQIVIYSSTGRRVEDFSAPLKREAPILASPLLWSPNGARLLLCIDPFGGLSFKARQKLIDTRQKRDRYPAPVPYLVDRDGTHWQKLQLPNPQKKETLCNATSWR